MTTRNVHTTRLHNGTIIFSDFPDFRPNLTPKEIFELGSFGGTYWRPINSRVTGKSHKNHHKKFPDLASIPRTLMTVPWSDYNKDVNRYGVKVGSTLEDWENSGWIVKQDPYGWVQWYCNFFYGRRTLDDERQVQRWINTAGPNSRFRKRLDNMIEAANASKRDYSISPKIRQTLQHWAVEYK